MVIMIPTFLHKNNNQYKRIPEKPKQHTGNVYRKVSCHLQLLCCLKHPAVNVMLQYCRGQTPFQNVCLPQYMPYSHKCHACEITITYLYCTAAEIPSDCKSHHAAH